MRKNFLLLLWLTMLPLALWAAAPSAVTGLKYTGSAQTVANAGDDWGYEYRYAITQGTSKPSWAQSSTTLPTALNAGTYRVYWASRYYNAVNQSTWNSSNSWFEVKIEKAEVTVELFQVVKMWRGAGYWSDPTVADMQPSSYSLGTSPFAWDDIKGYLTWNQLQAVTDVGSYKYTLTAAEAQNFNIHVDGTAAELKVEQNNTAGWAQAATDGANLTYSGEAQQLLPTDEPLFEDADGVTAGKIQYRIYSPTEYLTEWADEIPSATNAATYNIQYKAISDKNHTEFTTTKSYNVTIDPYELVAGTDFTAPTAVVGTLYDEAAHEIATAGAFTGKFAAELATAGAKFTYNGWDDLPEETNVGTYSFDWDINLGTSTNFSYTTGATTVSGATIVEAEIVAADVTAPVGATGLEYILDTTQKLIATGAIVAQDNNTLAPKGEAWYSVDGGTWTNDLTKVVGEHVKASDGKYVVSWYIKGSGNYKDYGSEASPAGTVEVGIAPVQFVLAADAEGATGLVFNNADQKLLSKSVTGGAANMPTGSTTWSLNGTALAAGSTYEDVKGKNAGTYHVSYTVVPKEAKYANDYLPYTKEDIPVFIDQYTLYIGAKSLNGTVEDFVDLETMTPKFKMSDFLKDGAFIGGESDTEKEAILNQLIAPKKTPAQIIAEAKVGANIIELQPVVVDPDVTPMNYKVDDATLLSDNATLSIEAIEAAIQADPVAATLTYNGDDQELVGTAAEGYKANGGAGTVAIGKVVYSLEKEGTYTDDLTTIVGKDAGDYTVYYKVELSEEATSLDRFYEYTAEVKELPVAIAQKALDIAMFEFDPASQTAVYNGQNQLPVITTVATEPIVDADWYFEFADGAGNPIADPNTGVKNVDLYAITFKAEADGNYTGEVSTTWEITKKALDDEMFTLSENVTYTGAAQKPTISTGDEPIVEADYTIEVKDSEGNVVAIDALVDADTYTFNFIAAADGNYSGNASAEWTIGQKDLDITMFTLSSYEETYDGSDLMPDFTFADGTPSALADTDFKVATTNSKPEAVTEMVDADTYTFTFTATADGNYTGEVSADFVIKQDEAEFVLAEAINLTYNGKEQILVTEAKTDAVEGKVEYAVAAYDGENLGAYGEPSEDLPQIRDAGKYSVKTIFTASAINYTNPEVEETVDVTINKATIGYNLGNLTKTWDGELFSDEEVAKLFTLYAGGEGGMLFDGDEYDKPFTLTLPEDYRDAGTYTFKQPTVEFKEGYPVNYNVNFAGEAEIIINKADITEADFTAPKAIAGVVYNKEDQPIIEEGVVTTDYQYPDMTDPELIGTMLYATSEDAETWSEDAPLGKDAGGYTVYFKVLGDKNHNDFEATLIEDVKIGEAELTADFLPETYETELPYKAAAYEATDFIPALDENKITLGEGYEVYAPEMINAGEYELLYKGINNYAGEFTVTVKVTPIDVIATAPKGVTKVYDGTASLENAKIGEKALSNEDIAFNGVISPDKIELPTELAMTTEGIAVGKYAITVDPSKFTSANPNYNILSETIEGEVEITKAPAIKVGFDAVPTTWTKEFGEDDPELTGYTVKVTDGEFFDNIDDVLAATTAVRAEGENVGTYDVTLTIDATADVFANYEGVAFDETAATFEITKSSKTYTVSLANIEEIYNGEEFATAIEFTAEDLVIAGYTGDKAKFFTTMPTASIPEGAKTVGDYNITLAEGESQNFKFTLVPATFTIKPFNVTTATIESQKVQKGKELDVTKFTITAPAADAEKFYVTAPGLVDMNDIVTGDAGVHKDALVIAVDDEVAANYTGLDAFTADLEIISADAIILADDDDFTSDGEDDVDVTFTSRKVNAGDWNVMALPFAATVGQISDAFGYAAVDILKKDNTAADEVHFTVITTGSVPAFEPFLVKTTLDGEPVENFDQVVFHGVNIEKMETAENNAVSDAAGNQFIGTFKAETKFWGAQYRYMSKGAWYNAKKYTESNPVTLKPFRGYLETVSASARIFIEEPDGTITAIDAVSFNKANAEGMYNLNGVKVNNLNRKGVYIKDGVKVIK